MPKKPVVVEDKPKKELKLKAAKTVKTSKKVKKSAKLAKSGKRAATTPPKGSVNPFAAVMRNLRKKLGKTTRDFAEEAGFRHGPAISRLESEEYFGTSVATMLRIADAVGGELVIDIKLGK